MVKPTTIYRNPIYADIAEDLQLEFQDASSPAMEKIIFLHDEIMLAVVIVTSLVLWMLVRSMVNRRYDRYLSEGAAIEVVWTLVPAVILVAIAIPSLKLLYAIDEAEEPDLTLKVVAHQWY